MQHVDLEWTERTFNKIGAGLKGKRIPTVFHFKDTDELYVTHFKFIPYRATKLICKGVKYEIVNKEASLNHEDATWSQLIILREI